MSKQPAAASAIRPSLETLGGARPFLFSSGADLVLLFLFAIGIHIPYLFRRPFFFADDFGLLADADNLTTGSTGFFDVPAWGVWRLGERAIWWLEYRIFGLNSVRYAAVSICLHGFVVIAVAVVCRRLGWGRPRSAAAALLFASLAVPSLAVRYLVQSTVMVCALMVIGSLIAFDENRPILAAVLVALGAVFYEQALCAPLLMIAVNVWRRRRPFAFVGPSFAAAALFVAINLWTLRHATKIAAYNSAGVDPLRQILFAPWLALGGSPALTMRPWTASLVLSLLIAVVVVAIRWAPARGVLFGLAFASIAALPFVGRSVAWWPEYYFYLPGVGAAMAVAAPSLKWWPLACVPLIAWNVREQGPRQGLMLELMRRYEQVTRECPVGRPPYAAFLNVHSALAWAGWQYGGSLRGFELWDAPEGPTRCYTGESLSTAREAMKRDFPAATRRGRWPEDRPANLRNARPPARQRLFHWPPT